MKKFLIAFVSVFVSVACAVETPQDSWVFEEWESEFRTVVPADEGFAETMKADTRFKISRSSENGKAQLVVFHHMFEDDVYIRWNEFIDTVKGNDNSHKVRLAMRIDDQPVSRKEWRHSSSMKATFYLGSVDEFLGDLEGAKQLSVSIIPYAKKQIEHVFQLEGLTEALVSLRDHKALEDPEIDEGISDY